MSARDAMRYDDAETRRIPGPDFWVEVPSGSRPGHRYKIARDDGLVIHPGCLGFRAHGHCHHVDRARALSERPGETLVTDFLEAWHAGGWKDPARFGQTAIEAAREAEAALTRLVAWQALVARRAAAELEMADRESLTPAEQAAAADRELEALR